MLPSQSNGREGGEGNHIAQSSGTGTGGSSCPHRMDSEVPPSGRTDSYKMYTNVHQKQKLFKV